MTELTPTERRELEGAVRLLETASFAVRLADYAGKPLNRVIGAIPKLNGVLRNTVHAAIIRCLELAIDSLEEEQFPPSVWLPKAMTGLTGGIGGCSGRWRCPSNCR